MRSSLVITVLAIVITHSYGRDKYFPNPDPKFNVKDWLGHWYMISRIVPCQWPGSRDFTDFRMYQCVEQSTGNVLTEDSWRSEGFCSSTIARFIPVPGLNGAFTVRDQIGGSWSSEVRVVLLDKKTGININWGCTQRAMSRQPGEPPVCKDEWVSVASRHLKISPYAKQLTYQALSALGFRESDLTPMRYTREGCEFKNQVCPRPKFMKIKKPVYIEF